MTALPADWN